MVSQLPQSRLTEGLDIVLEASVVGSFTKLGIALRRRWGGWSELPHTPGRVVVVTGASSGLGAYAAPVLAALGCTVVCVGRDSARLGTVVEAIEAQGGSACAEVADLADLEQAAALGDRLADRFTAIDVLIHNAGALLDHYSAGPQGFETTLSVHLLSPYVLTTRLAPTMARADQAKVITMTSGGMYTEAFDLGRIEMRPDRYRGSVAYARAKRAQVVLTAAWQRSEPPKGRTFAAVHPGWAATPGVAASLPTFEKVMSPLLRSAAEGVDTALWLATLPPGEPEGGLLWLDRAPRSPYKLSRTRRTRDQEAGDQDAVLAWLAETTAPFLPAS